MMIVWLNTLAVNTWSVKLVDSKFDYHYYRLGNGIPILEERKVYYLSAYRRMIMELNAHGSKVILSGVP